MAAKFFQAKANKTLAAAYAMYMMGGSYYRKTTCITQFMEQNCYLHYKEMKSNVQYQMERDMETAFRKAAGDFLPEFGDYLCEVTIRRDEDDITVLFYTGVADIAITIGEGREPAAVLRTA